MIPTNLTEELLIWSLFLGLGFPVTEILLGELIDYLKKDKNPLAGSLESLRNLVIPCLVFLLFLKYVLKVDNQLPMVKIVETAFWVCLIQCSLSVVNAILLGEKKDTESWRSQMPKFFQDLSRFILITVGIAIVLSVVWQIDLAGLITALGVGSIVIGLALQDVLGSVFSGIALLFERPFKVGDWLLVGDIEGKVIDMNWRSVHLETREKHLVIVPHLIIGKDKIINYSKPNRIQKEKITMGFAYQHPPNLVKQILKETAISSPGILAKPEPMIRTESYDDCAISYTIEFFIDNYDKKLDVYDELKTRIWYAAKRYNLNMPFPIREIYQMPPTIENNTNTFTEHLKSIPSLARMEQESLQSIADSAVLHHFAGGEKVIVEGDRVQALHLVIAGKARVTATNSKGKIEDLFILGKGEFFGEMSLFTGEPSAVTITALEDLEVLLIYADTANTMIDRQPSLAREIGQVMEARRKAVNIARAN